MHLMASGSAGVGDDVEGVPLDPSLLVPDTGLLLVATSRVPARRRQGLPSRAAAMAKRQLGDRTGLVDDESGNAVFCSSVQQRFEGTLVVDDRPSEDALTGVVQHLCKVLFFADVQPNPHVDLFGRGQTPLPSSLLSSYPGRPSLVRSHSSTLRTSDQSHVPIRGRHTDHAGGNTPQAINICRG